MLYVPYQGSDRCLHPLPLLPLPWCFALTPHQSTFSLSYWENDVAFITLSIIYCSPLVQPLHSLFTSPSAMPYQTTKGESFHSLVAKDDVFYSCSLPVVIFLFQAQPYYTIPYHTKSFSCCPSSCHQCHCPLV